MDEGVLQWCKHSNCQARKALTAVECLEDHSPHARFTAHEWELNAHWLPRHDHALSAHHRSHCPKPLYKPLVSILQAERWVTVIYPCCQKPKPISPFLFSKFSSLELYWLLLLWVYPSLVGNSVGKPSQGLYFWCVQPPWDSLDWEVGWGSARTHHFLFWASSWDRSFRNTR